MLPAQQRQALNTGGRRLFREDSVASWRHQMKGPKKGLKPAAFLACLLIDFRQDQAEVKIQTNICLQALLMAAVTS